LIFPAASLYIIPLLSTDEIRKLLTQVITDLEVRLEVSGGSYFHKTDAPTEIDVILAGFLMSILGCISNPFATSLILKSPKLVGLVKRLTQTLFPEYRGVLALLGGG